MICSVRFQLGKYTQVNDLHDATLELQCFMESGDYAWTVNVFKDGSLETVYNNVFRGDTLQWILNRVSMHKHTWWVFRDIRFVENVVEYTIRQQSETLNNEEEF
jgi:hypothetical protein